MNNFLSTANTPTFEPNPGKELFREQDGMPVARIPIRTHVITSADNIVDVCRAYAAHLLEADDILAISERIVAITQDRAYHINTITPSWLARTLSRFVTRSKSGIGLGSPYTMHLAIQEAGWFRILLAAACSVVTRPFGWRGVFYHVAGNNINAIDGPCSFTLPPYDQYAKLGPKDPNGVAQLLNTTLGCDVAIIDANDLGVRVLGKSPASLQNKMLRQLFADNPLGQSSQQTPLCIVRKVQAPFS